MHKCEVRGKETGNGITAAFKGRTISICSICAVLSDEPLAKQAREVARTGRKSRENGEIKGKDVTWAAYWTPDCETPKFRKVR